MDALATEQSPDIGWSLPSWLDEDGERGSEVAGDEGAPGTAEPDWGVSEAVEDQSEAPPEEDEGIIPTTEIPPAETEVGIWMNLSR